MDTILMVRTLHTQTTASNNNTYTQQTHSAVISLIKH